MASNYAKAGILSKHVELESILLKDARLSSRLDPFDHPDTVDVSFGYRASFQRREDHPDKLIVKIDFTMAIGAEEETDNEAGPSGSFDATYLLIYSLDGDAAACSDESFYHFAWLNGVHHSWPYWRELVHTVSARAGLPSILVPVFKPPVRELPDAHDPDFYTGAEEEDNETIRMK